MKVCEKCESEIFTKDGENQCPKCVSGKPVPKKKRVSNAKAKRAAMESLGLVRVRGAMGGVYWE